MVSYAERMLDDLDKGQLDAAKKSFAAALQQDDDDTIYSLAEELYALGFAKQAKRAYQQLLDKYPKEDQLRTNLADIAIDEGKTDQAIEYLAAIKTDSEAYLQALLVLADLYQSEGIYEVAEAKLKEAYQLAPEEPVIAFALAEYYYASGQYQEAIPYYRDLLKQGERKFSGVDVASRIGVAYALTGNVKNALGYLEQIKPADMTPDVQFQLGLTYAADEETYDQAIKTFEALADLDPAYVSLYIPLGALYEKQGQNEQALRTYQAGLAQDAFNPKLYERAAIVSMRLGKAAQAGHFLAEGLKNNPDDPTLVLDYSDWLVSQHKDQDNLDLLNHYLTDEEADIDPGLYRNLARSYTALEQDEFANRYWQAALPSYLSDPDFLQEAYYFFRKIGERELALQAIARYVKLRPEDYDMLNNYDDLLAEQDD